MELFRCCAGHGGVSICSLQPKQHRNIILVQTPRINGGCKYCPPAEQSLPSPLDLSSWTKLKPQLESVGVFFSLLSPVFQLGSSVSATHVCQLERARVFWHKSRSWGQCHALPWDLSGRTSSVQKGDLAYSEEICRECSPAAQNQF